MPSGESNLSQEGPAIHLRLLGNLGLQRLRADKRHCRGTPAVAE